MTAQKIIDIWEAPMPSFKGPYITIADVIQARIELARKKDAKKERKTPLK